MNCCICGNVLTYANAKNQHGEAKTCGETCKEKRKNFLKGVGWTMYARCPCCDSKNGEPCFDSEGEIKTPCNGREKMLIIKSCKNCKVKFNTKSSCSKFCSKSCREKFHGKKTKNKRYAEVCE